MHSVAFNLKRGFHSFLNLTRHAFRKLELTAARFDMLHAIHERGRVRQSTLREVLGVSAPTVSRMLRSLEKLGFVHRQRGACLDRRQVVLNVTPLGRAILLRAWDALSPNVDLAFDCALAKDRWWDEEGTCFMVRSDVEGHLWDVRYAFRDRASLQYAWHPDD